jgi:hypothetical protein
MTPWLGLLAMLATGQAAEPPARSAAAVVVVTQDQLRQGQARYGRDLLAMAGGRWGGLDISDAPLSAEALESCQDDRDPASLAHCVRFYVLRAGSARTGGPPIVAVVFDDAQAGPETRRRGGEMQVSCFGPGTQPSDAASQTTWLWPGAFRMHGVNDLERDKAALTACIRAAAAERPA